MGNNISLNRAEQRRQSAILVLEDGENAGHGVGVQLTGQVRQLQQYLRSGVGILQGAVKALAVDFQRAGNADELVACERRQKNFRHIVGVHPGVGQDALQMILQHAPVEADVMGH